MADLSNGKRAGIVVTERRLTLSGTRITLCDVMDYLKAQYPLKLIGEKLDLNEEQINTALAYINLHQSEVEAEYQQGLLTAQEIRQYWEEQNRERLAKMALMPPKPGTEALRTKLQAGKEHIDSQS